jgi:hypothetical protein
VLSSSATAASRQTLIIIHSLKSRDANSFLAHSARFKLSVIGSNLILDRHFRREWGIRIFLGQPFRQMIGFVGKPFKRLT